MLRDFVPFCRVLNVLVGSVVILFGAYYLFNIEQRSIYTFCPQTSPAPVSSLDDSVTQKRPEGETDQKVLQRPLCPDSEFDDLNKFEKANSDASF